MKRFLFQLLLLCPTLLFGGFFDWFFTSPDEVTQFECPHSCGEWGSESMKKVEWQAVLALWEFDKMGYAFKGEEFPYPREPQGFDDPIYEEFRQKGVCFPIHLKNKDIKVDGALIDTSYEEENEIYWSICNHEEGEKKGLIFISDYYTDNEEIDYEDDYEVSYLLENLKDLKRFKNSLLDDIRDTYRCITENFYANILNSFENDILSTEKDLLDYNKILKSCSNEYMINIYKSIIQSRKELLPKLENEKAIWKAEYDGAYDLSSKYLIRVQSKLQGMKDTYCHILDDCIALHNAPAAYLQRAKYHFQEGFDMNCIADIKKLFEMTPPERLNEELKAKLGYRQGKLECEIGLFEDAIYTLSNYIKSHPNHRGAYLQRAIALFEKGNFQEAIEDFAQTGFGASVISPTLGDELEFSTGIVKGMTIGATEALGDFVPSMLTSAQGLSNGLWAFATDPKEVTYSMYWTCKKIVKFIKESGARGALFSLFPEVRELVEKGDQLSFLEQGALIGKLVGRYGTEFLLFKGAAVGVKLYRNLRFANAALTMKRMSVSARAEQIIMMHHKQWWEKTAPLINKLKASKGSNFGKELFKEFGKHPLSEHQIRRILHHGDYKTFPRPKGLPKDAKVKFSKKGGGMVYVKAGTNEKENILIRVMPGNSNSPNVHQRSPYVVQRRGKHAVLKDGQDVLHTKTEAHIPLEEFEFKGW